MSWLHEFGAAVDAFDRPITGQIDRYLKHLILKPITSLSISKKDILSVSPCSCLMVIFVCSCFSIPPQLFWIDSDNGSSVVSVILRPETMPHTYSGQMVHATSFLRKMVYKFQTQATNFTLCGQAWDVWKTLKNQAFTGDNGLHGVFPKGQLGQGLVSVRAVSRKSNKFMGLRPLDISLRDSNLYYYFILFQIQIISNYDELVHTDLINALNVSYSYINCRSCTRARSCRPHFAQALSSCRVKVEWLQGGKMPTVCLSKLLWIALFERHFHLKMHTSTQD